MADQNWDINNYKPPADGSVFYGKEQHFNEDVVFYKGIRIHGNLDFDFSKFEKLVVTQLDVIGPDENNFFGPVNFQSDVDISADLDVDNLTVRNRFEVGEIGEIIVADSSEEHVGIFTSVPDKGFQIGAGSSSITYVFENEGLVDNVLGIGTTNPGAFLIDSEGGIDPGINQNLKLDVEGSIRIKNTIFDSADVPGQNGYFFARDQRGVRWLQQIADDDGVMPLSVVLWGGNGNFPPPGYEVCDGTNGKPNLAPVTDLNGTVFQYIIKVV